MTAFSVRHSVYPSNFLAGNTWKITESTIEKYHFFLCFSPLWEELNYLICIFLSVPCNPWHRLAGICFSFLASKGWITLFVLCRDWVHIQFKNYKLVTLSLAECTTLSFVVCRGEVQVVNDLVCLFRTEIECMTRSQWAYQQGNVQCNCNNPCTWVASLSGLRRYWT